jgi:hypothetical protein
VQELAFQSVFSGSEAQVESFVFLVDEEKGTLT